MWFKEYDGCVVCGTTEIRHQGFGMCKKCYIKKYRKKNFKKEKENNRRWRIENLEKYKDNQKKWREKNKEKCREYNKIYREENKEQLRKKHRKYRSNRLNSDSCYKLKDNISALIRERLKRRLLNKSGKFTFSFLPYTVDDLIQHLEKQFKSGMSWNNHNRFGWHIDHKTPDCKFDYKNVEDEEFQRCWALENLQPLWAEENLRKNKYEI